MNKKIIVSLASATLLALPAVILAFNAGSVPNSLPNLNVGDLADIIFGILWPIAVVFFVVMFILAAFRFFTAGGKPEDVAIARQYVIYGAVGVVVALLAFSIPFIIRNQIPGL